METRKTVRETKMFNSSGSFRDDLAAGKYIEGDPSGTKFICRVETPEMRVGWYIMLVDTILVTPEPPPVDPPPVDPPVDPPPDSGYTLISSTVVYSVDGVTYSQKMKPDSQP